MAGSARAMLLNLILVILNPTAQVRGFYNFSFLSNALCRKFWCLFIVSKSIRSG